MFTTLGATLLFVTAAHAQLKLMDPPISYLEKTPHDVVAKVPGNSRVPYGQRYGSRRGRRRRASRRA